MTSYKLQTVREALATPQMTAAACWYTHPVPGDCSSVAMGCIHIQPDVLSRAQLYRAIAEASSIRGGNTHEMGSWKTILTYHPRSSSHNTADYVAWMREVAKLNPKLINITEVPTRTYSSKTRNFRVAIIEAYKSWDIEWPTDSALGSTTDPKEQQLVWCCQPGGGWHERGSGLRPEKWAESRGVK